MHRSESCPCIQTNFNWTRENSEEKKNIKSIPLTWMPCNCCQFFVRAHRIWHRWMVPMCNNIAYQQPQSHSTGQLHLVNHSDYLYVPLQCHRDNVQPSTHTDTFGAKTAVKTVYQESEGGSVTENKNGTKIYINNINWMKVYFQMDVKFSCRCVFLCVLSHISHLTSTRKIVGYN